MSSGASTLRTIFPSQGRAHTHTYTHTHIHTHSQSCLSGCVTTIIGYPDPPSLGYKHLQIGWSDQIIIL